MMNTTIRSAYVVLRLALIGTIGHVSVAVAQEAGSGPADGAATDADQGMSTQDATADDVMMFPATQAAPVVPVACDGALCDTSNDATCSLSRSHRADMGWRCVPLVLAFVFGAVAARRVRSRRHGAAEFRP
jgi:hypothetical protein